MSYCLKCKKDTESANSKVLKTKIGRTMLLSKCAVCGNKKSRFIQQPVAKGLLSHFVKSVQKRSYFWYVFSSIRTEYGEIFSWNAKKYGPEITPFWTLFTQ